MEGALFLNETGTRLIKGVHTMFYSSEPEALRAFLEPRLARFEIPRYLRLSESPLPRTASGKIFKRQLREEALRALA